MNKSNGNEVLTELDKSAIDRVFTTANVEFIKEELMHGVQINTTVKAHGKKVANRLYYKVSREIYETDQIEFLQALYPEMNEDSGKRRYNKMLERAAIDLTDRVVKDFIGSM